MASQEYLQWCSTQGIKMNGVMAGEVTDGGRGLIATRELVPGDVFLEVPESLLISLASARADPVLRPILKSHPDAKHLDSQQLLAIHLLNEVSKASQDVSNSKWALYLKELPRSYTTLSYFGPEAIRQLQVPMAQDAAHAALSKLQDEWRQARPLLQALDVVPKYGSFAAWRWAMTTLLSRTMYVSWDSAGTLAPFGDLLNHQNPPPPHTTYCDLIPPRCDQAPPAQQPDASESNTPTVEEDPASQSADGTNQPVSNQQQPQPSLPGVDMSFPLSNANVDHGPGTSISHKNNQVDQQQQQQQTSSSYCGPPGIQHLTVQEPSDTTSPARMADAQPVNGAMTAASTFDTPNLSLHTTPTLVVCTTGNGEQAVHGTVNSDDRRDCSVIGVDNAGVHSVEADDAGTAQDCAASNENTVVDDDGLWGDGLYDPDSKMYKLYARRRYLQGSQVYVSYGQHHNLDLLSLYGFVLPDNPHEAVQIPLDVLEAAWHVINSSMNPKANKKATPTPPHLPHLTPEDCTLHTDGSPTWALLKALRSAAATPAERYWKAPQIAAGQQVSTEGDRKLLLWLKTAATALLAALPTTMAEDHALLAKPEAVTALAGTGTCNQAAETDSCPGHMRQMAEDLECIRLAVQWRAEYKRVLNATVSLCDLALAPST